MMNRSRAVHHVAVTLFLTSLSGQALALEPGQPPSGNFDLTHWKLTLPIGRQGKPDEVLPAQLSDAYVHAPYFLSSPVDGAMRFWAPVTGVTTQGSTYPRSELREQRTPGKDSPNWYANGTHVLEAECRIIQVPSSGRVIIGQVHGKKTPTGEAANPLVKLAYDAQSRSLRVQVKASPHRQRREESTDVVGGIELGTLIKYQIKIVDGVAHVTVNGKRFERDFYATDPDWAKTDLYFKAGAYTLDNQGPSTEGAQVDFYVLRVRHDGADERATVDVSGTPLKRAVVDNASDGNGPNGGVCKCGGP
jgi:hypothetical protein